MQRRTIGLAAALIGAALLIIATFLPMLEPVNAFQQIQANTLIQHDGWQLVIAGVALGGGAYWIFSKGDDATRGDWGSFFGGTVLVGALLINFIARDSSHTLYATDAQGHVITSGPGLVVPWGVGPYAAGVGVALVFVGAVLLLPPSKEDRLEAAG